VPLITLCALQPFDPAAAPGLVDRLEKAEPGLQIRWIGEKTTMIGRGHPESEQNAKALRKSNAVLFYATDSCLLFVREEHGWVCLGHCVPLDAPRWSQPIPRVQGHPYGTGPRLQGVK